MNLSVIDFSAAFYRSWRFGEDATEHFQHELRHGWREPYVFAFDCPPYWRSEKLPTYKSHRPPKPPGFSMAKLKCIELASKYEWRSLPAILGEEADDIIGMLVTHPRAKSHMFQVMSGDKDMLQLESHNVAMYSAGGNFKQSSHDRLELPPWLVADYLAICGDAGDGISGCPGIGDVWARHLVLAGGTLEQLLEPGALEAALKKCPKKLPAKKRGVLNEWLQSEQSTFSKSLVVLGDRIEHREKFTEFFDAMDAGF